MWAFGMWGEGVVDLRCTWGGGMQLAAWAEGIKGVWGEGPWSRGRG